MTRRPATKAAVDRRAFLHQALGAAGAWLLAGCDSLSRSEWFPMLLGTAETATRKAQRLLSPREAMAKEFPLDERSPVFPVNGTSHPQNEAYWTLARGGFADWRLEVGGLVRAPASVSLAELRAMPARTQVTRHDCVEGWSAIAKWKGVRLSALLERVQPLPSARYLVFYCADPDEDGQPYYESIDFEDGHHPQTMLAYEINDATLPVQHGAPVRLRVERQLGYKQAKYVMRIDAVESFASIAGGKGGYWEDRGYEWYAGI